MGEQRSGPIQPPVIRKGLFLYDGERCQSLRSAATKPRGECVEGQDADGRSGSSMSGEPTPTESGLELILGGALSLTSYLIVVFLFFLPLSGTFAEALGPILSSRRADRSGADD